MKFNNVHENNNVTEYFNNPIDFCSSSYFCQDLESQTLQEQSVFGLKYKKFYLLCQMEAQLIIQTLIWIWHIIHGLYPVKT